MKMTRQFQGLADLKFNAALLYGMIFTAVFCPGLLVIYVYKYNLFLSLDVTKLVLLAIATGSPLFGWSLFLAMLLVVFDCNLSKLYFSESQIYDILLLASFQAFLVLNLSLGLSWLLSWDFQTFFKNTVYISLILALLVTAAILQTKYARSKQVDHDQE